MYACGSVHESMCPRRPGGGMRSIAGNTTICEPPRIGAGS